MMRTKTGALTSAGQGPLPRGRAHPHGRWVGHEDGARIEQRQQGAEIPAPGGRKAATISRFRDRAASDAAAAPCTRRRARLASCRAATGERSMIAPTSPNDTSKTSCKTNASRSAGVSVSSTTISAAPTESASSASSSGPAGLAGRRVA